MDKHKSVWRVAALILLLVSVLGPWTYTSDGVPPAEWCRDPYILLADGHCVSLVSGGRVFAFAAAVLPSMAAQLAAGGDVVAGRTREFLGVLLFVVLLLLLVQPLVSTLLLILRGDRRSLRVYNIVAWGIAAALSGVLLALLCPSGLSLRLWGLWLYLAVAVCALALELLLWGGRTSRKEQQSTQAGC
jgi:hypothetical protein